MQQLFISKGKKTTQTSIIARLELVSLTNICLNIHATYLYRIKKKPSDDRK